MEEFKDYFKSRKEEEKFFKDEVFKFTYMSENMISFETLYPISIDSELVNFELTFYYENQTFFAYSNFNTWFEELQLMEVSCSYENQTSGTKMYFSKYKDSNENLN